MPWFCHQLRVDENTVPGFFGVYAFPAGVSDDEIEHLKKVIEKYPEQEGKVGLGYNRENKRISRVKWVSNEDPDLVWLLDRLQVMIQQANSTMRWNFELDGFYEHLQYARYEGEAGGYFDGHYDVGKNPIQASRKLSISIQLTDPVEYEGGDLELYNIGPAPKQKGTVVIFPSFLMHRVSPVTKGIRESLIVWVSGPPFK